MLAEGQKWFYSNDVGSYLIIRRIEKGESQQVIHITIKNIRVKDESWDICHIPIEYEALSESLKTESKINLSKDDTEEFEEAYSLWRKDKGGVWGLPLKDVIKNTLINIGLISNEE